MERRKKERQRLNKIVVGGLRETIRAHGLVTKLLIGSAAKRIVGTLLSKEKKDEGIHNDAEGGACTS